MDYKNNVIIIEGEEYYLRKKKLEEIVSTLLPDSFSDFNYLKLDGKRVSLREILSSWEELPFGAPRRVVHVENFEKVKVKSSDKKVYEMFLSAVKSGNIKKSFLILECESFDKRAAFNKEIARSAEIFSFKKVREWEFPQKIVEYANSKGYLIDRDGVDFIASSFSDLMTLYSELDKLFAYKKEDKKITLNDIKEVLFPAKEYTFFDIQDALIEKNLQKALRVGTALIEGGTSFASISGFLESTFKKSYTLAFEEKPSNLSYYQRKLLSLAGIYKKEGIERALILIYKVLSLSRKGTLPETVYITYLFAFLQRIADRGK
ncbi:hypothetical protein TTHT_1607 [Thermotomaculum hydrothermale]|uniref:DNA polymerase III delta N-terminal domain-containing protein n=1 Tax=Thermotomaculum hydrothermale TaxID=981385 RepID=A0A7R6PYC6_9BACT|nr:DNA polymerase III subunit delta [Thermotomaculum hydrothermale]BBB33095.1 hypothetical protein TTHT_1607 [Thermotomaculum hydrothermale]